MDLVDKYLNSQHNWKVFSGFRGEKYFLINEELLLNIKIEAVWGGGKTAKVRPVGYSEKRTIGNFPSGKSKAPFQLNYSRVDNSFLHDCVAFLPLKISSSSPGKSFLHKLWLVEWQFPLLNTFHWFANFMVFRSINFTVFSKWLNSALRRFLRWNRHHHHFPASQDCVSNFKLNRSVICIHNRSYLDANQFPILVCMTANLHNKSTAIKLKMGIITHKRHMFNTHHKWRI